MSVQPGDTITATVSGSEGDFLKNLKSVVLNQPNGSTASIGPEDITVMTNTIRWRKITDL